MILALLQRLLLALEYSPITSAMNVGIEYQLSIKILGGVDIDSFNVALSHSF
ncbi:hypothetical protein OK016_10365 [Vibrio chagasii]|nr:hypothetical protein [Vibrio chagasii]